MHRKVKLMFCLPYCYQLNSFVSLLISVAYHTDYVFLFQRWNELWHARCRELENPDATNCANSSNNSHGETENVVEKMIPDYAVRMVWSTSSASCSLSSSSPAPGPDNLQANKCFNSICRRHLLTGAPGPERQNALNANSCYNLILQKHRPFIFCRIFGLQQLNEGYKP